MNKQPIWTVAPTGTFHPDNMQQLNRVAKALGQGFVPRSVGLQAAAMLADRARNIAMKYRVPYRQGVEEALRETPALRLGLRPLLPDEGFESDVTLVEARDDEHE